MRQMRSCAFLVMISTALLFSLEPQPANADPSCTAFLASKWQQAKSSGYVYPRYVVELTMHREDTNFVSYSVGNLYPQVQMGSFAGNATQLFSDRLVDSQTGTPGGQPFNSNAADGQTLHLSPTGLLGIHYLPWNFDTAWDLSCKGSVLTSYLPGFGVVTLTFRDLRDDL